MDGSDCLLSAAAGLLAGTLRKWCGISTTDGKALWFRLKVTFVFLKTGRHIVQIFSYHGQSVFFFFFFLFILVVPNW